jgi:hypothetical protein
LIRALETTAAVSNCCDKIFDNPQFNHCSIIGSIFKFWNICFPTVFLFCVFMAFLIPELADTPPPMAIWLIPVFFYS